MGLSSEDRSHTCLRVKFNSVAGDLGGFHAISPSHPFTSRHELQPPTSSGLVTLHAPIPKTHRNTHWVPIQRAQPPGLRPRPPWACGLWLSVECVRWRGVPAPQGGQDSGLSVFLLNTPARYQFSVCFLLLVSTSHFPLPNCKWWHP